MKVDGLVNKPGDYDLEDLSTPHALEERIYRLRCVEAWSMVIPWVGLPAGRPAQARRAARAGEVRRVHHAVRSEADAGPARRACCDWPYVEGLRLDEAMHPLTILAVGLYGEVLPNQNGAPLRLVVPWKYGFKSIKSIVRSGSSTKQPVDRRGRRRRRRSTASTRTSTPTSTTRAGARPRERRIGEFLKRKTLMFNGYADQVAGLYAGMDLKKNF